MPTSADITVTVPAPGPGALGDFWRTAPGNALPDGVADVQDSIGRNGLVSIQGVAVAPPPNFNPVAALDVAYGGRSGVDGRVVNVTPFYVTGALPAIVDVTTPPATPVGGVEFRHSNQTQGIGFGYDVIYATGNTATQGLHFMNRGAGLFQFVHQTLNGGLNYFDKVSPALAVNQGWAERYFAANVNKMTELHRQANLGVGGTLGMETYWQRTNAAGGFQNAMYLGPSATDAGTFTLMIDPSNQLNDAKVVLYGFNSTSFFGFGIKGSTLAYFVPAGSFHRWYVGPSPGTALFSISSVGNVTVDPTGVGPAGFASPVLRFGSEASGEAIRSQRVGVGPDLNALSFFVGALQRFSIRSNGHYALALLPTFATDALAGAGGMLVGELYKHVDGSVHQKL